jgi:subtilisin
LPNLPDFAKGKGVKIAIIDSGADTNHPLLNHIKLGLDASTGGQRDGWKVDAIGHGSHVAGVITANGGGRSMYTGFAPEAEIHVIKVFPGGYDTLIQALNYCVAQRVDVVNMSLGGAEISVAVEQALQEATLAGIACIVAAGNSGDAVKYPASSPNALAVGAVGNTVETRAQSWAQTQIIVDSIAADGTYPAKFSCHGPQIGVCAPGVAIVSTLPGDSYGTDDGTSMASPHVTGLAALILAHHPLFRTTLAERNQARVAALFSIVRDLCTAYPFSDGRAGAGMPTLTQSAVREFIQGLDPSQGTIPVAPQGTSPGVPAGGEQLHALSAFPGQDGNGGRAFDPRVWLGRQTGHPDGQFVWAAGPGQFGGLVWVPSPGILPSPLGNGFVRPGQGIPYFRG